MGIQQFSFFVSLLNKYKEREPFCTFLYINLTPFVDTTVVCFHTVSSIPAIKQFWIQLTLVFICKYFGIIICFHNNL